MFDCYFFVVYFNFLYWFFFGDVCFNGFFYGFYNGLFFYFGFFDDFNYWWIYFMMNSDGCWYGYSWYRGWIFFWNKGNRMYLFFVGFGFYCWLYYYFFVCFYGYIDYFLVVNFFLDYLFFLVNFVICICFRNFDDFCFFGVYVLGLLKLKFWIVFFWLKIFVIFKNIFWFYWFVV